MVKLSAELIEQAAQYTNPVRDRELDLRGEPPVHSAMLFQFGLRIGEGLEHCVPNLKELVLTNNNIQELGDLDPLASIKTLTLLRNPVTNKKHYRLYVINKIPQLRVLDFQKVKLKERQEAEKMFKGKRGAQLAKDIAKRSKTFTPGATLQMEKRKAGPSQADVEAIKNAIASATSLAEVERLKGLLQSGQIPGRDMRQGMVEEEEEENEDDIAHGGAMVQMEEAAGEDDGREGEEEGGEEDDGEEMEEDTPMNGSA
ncbi:U2 small nuclear ribonucleoprotein A'-like [Scleropages formosus]|uniref:U2 small nuclear ribonucleoprotein A'-like n=1 Tax=Scleropages formosus TaxID=113540 RepID=A0A0P7YVE7_SCLFO|nr:U2 small nuclear ribonucleoprotein A'-like [Scleropages formosus]